MPAWIANSWLLLWPPLCIGLAAVCHVLIAWFSRRRAEWGHMALGILFGGVILWGAMIAVVLGGRAPSDMPAVFLLNTLSYLGLALLYWDFNNTCLTSVRLRVLRECQESRDGLTNAQLMDRYDVTSLVTTRLDKYVRQRYLVQQAGTYRIGNPAIVWLCRIYELIHRILFGTSMPTGMEPEETAPNAVAQRAPGGSSQHSEVPQPCE